MSDTQPATVVIGTRGCQISGCCRSWGDSGQNGLCAGVAVDGPDGLSRSGQNGLCAGVAVDGPDGLSRSGQNGLCAGVAVDGPDGLSRPVWILRCLSAGFSPDGSDLFHSFVSAGMGGGEGRW